MILDRVNISEIKGPVYIAPAGCVGFVTYHALRRYGIEVVGFCDNNEGLSGKSYDNCPMLSPKEAFSQNPKAIFVIATIHFRMELAEQFRGLGADNLLYAGQFITQDIFSEALEDLDVDAAQVLTTVDNPKITAVNNAEPFWMFEPRLDIHYSGSVFFYPPDYTDYMEALKQWLSNINISAKFEIFDRVSIYTANTADAIKQLLNIVLYLKEHLKKPTNHILIRSLYLDTSSLFIRNLQEEFLSTGIEFKNVTDAEIHKLHFEKPHTTNIPIVLYEERPYSNEENKYNCVYTHIPKNAGSSISKMLKSWHSHHKLALHCKMFDAERFNNFFKFAIVRNPWDWLVSWYFFSQKQAKDNYWTSIDHKFVNPKSRIYYSDFRDYVLSLKTQKDGIQPNWRYNAGGDITADTFRDYVLNLNIPKNGIQSNWICDEEDNIIVDYVGRFENLPESVRYIREKLGMNPDAPLPHVNITKHKRYTEYYNEEMIKIVREVFKRDIELFGYEFDKHPGPDIIINSREDFVPVSKR